MQPFIRSFFLLGTALLAVLFLHAQNKPTGQVQNPNLPSGPVQPLPSGYPYTGTVNYVRTWVPVKKMSDPNAVITASNQDAPQVTQYLDGLGRTIQTVQRAVSPDQKDLVAPKAYDAFSREALQYLPYVSSATDGAFQANPFQDQQSFYQSGYKDINGQTAFPNEQIYYAQTQFEASPLSRVQKTMAPGNSWGGQDIGISQEYLFNTILDNVQTWTIGYGTINYASNDAATNIPAASGVYAPGTLTKLVTKDEMGKVVVQYSDRLGHLILKKVQLLDNVPADYSGYDGFLCTYYIYDDFDRLRFILPPKAVDAIRTDWNLNGKTDVINELCFRYEFDSRDRTYAQKSPGTGWNLMVYDRLDRLVFTQDANLRSKNQWMTTLYDELNRPVLTGIIIYNGDLQQLQSIVSAQTVVTPLPSGTQSDLVLSSITSGAYLAYSSITLDNGFESASGTELSAEIVSGSTSVVEGIEVGENPIPQGAIFIALGKTFYDNYQWTPKTYTTANSNYLDDGGNPNAEVLPSSASVQTGGLVTGSMIRTLDDGTDITKGKWLTSVSFYDEQGRVVQVQSDNYEGGDEITTNRYDYSGKVLTAYTAHNNPALSPSSIALKTTMKYDAAGRPLELWKTINNNDSKKALIARYQYDVLGNMVRKELGRKQDGNGRYTATPLEQLDYTYNIRGWLKGINSVYVQQGAAAKPDAHFGIDLSYDWGFEKNQLNGNISGARWRSGGDGEQRAYGFSYDAAGRLMAADFNQLYSSSWQKNDPANADYVTDLSVKMGDGIDPLQAYDANGNIKRMQQWGIKLKSSPRIDDLTYSYNFNYSTNTNKLSGITDAFNDKTSSFGDFKYDPATKTTADYSYDNNGNITADQNKKLGTMGYNYLDLPFTLTVNGTKTVSYVYDATGEKLQKKVVDNSASPAQTTITYYNGDFIYEQANGGTAQLQYIMHEEGGIRYQPAVGAAPESFVYDYFIKDQLENVRTVITEERQLDIYPVATLEFDGATYPAGDDGKSPVVKERDFYSINKDNIKESKDIPGLSDAIGYPYTNENNNGTSPRNNNPYCTDNSLIKQTDNSAKLYKLQATASGPAIGLGFTIKVMNGDKIDIFGKSYYLNAAMPSDNKAMDYSTIISDMVGTPGSIIGKGTSIGDISSLPLTTAALGSFLSDPNRDKDGTGTTNLFVPKAYINWILFDDNFKYVAGNFSRAGTSHTVKSHHSDASMQGIPVTKNGYLYVYVSNESQAPVYFDNLQVVHTRGPVLEETHYYPYGLKIQALSSRAGNKLKNLYGYQGSFSEEEEETGYNEFALRRYDPQIGRWTGADPYNQFASPYVGLGGNPINYIDPNGGAVFDLGSDFANAAGNTVLAAAAGYGIGYLIDGQRGATWGAGIGAGMQLGSYVNWNQVGSAIGYAGSWVGSTFGGSQNLYRDFTTQSLISLGFKYNILYQKNLVQKLNVTRLGRIFQDAVANSLGVDINYHPFYPIGSPSGTEPDIVGPGATDVINPLDFWHPDRYVFPNASFQEIKFKSTVFFEDTWNKEQLKKMINVLAEMKGGFKNGKYDANLKAVDFGAASLTLITPTNTLIDIDLIKYATDHKVKLLQRVVEQKISNEKVIRVRKGVKFINPPSVGGSLPMPLMLNRRSGNDSILDFIFVR